MVKFSAPWADGYISVMDSMYSLIDGMQDPGAKDRASKAVRILFDAYRDMGFYGEDFQDGVSDFRTGDAIMDKKLKGVEYMLPDFKKAVYNFYSECRDAGIDPYICFDDYETVFLQPGEESTDDGLGSIAMPPKRKACGEDLPGGRILVN